DSYGTQHRRSAEEEALRLVSEAEAKARTVLAGAEREAERIQRDVGQRHEALKREARMLEERRQRVLESLRDLAAQLQDALVEPSDIGRRDETLGGALDLERRRYAEANGPGVASIFGISNRAMVPKCGAGLHACTTPASQATERKMNASSRVKPHSSTSIRAASSATSSSPSGNTSAVAWGIQRSSSSVTGQVPCLPLRTSKRTVTS